MPVVFNDGVARRFGVVDVSSRSSHLEIWYIFLHDLVSGSHVFGVWVLFSVCRALDSLGDDLVYGRNAWFDSGYILYVGIALALGRIPRFSTLLVPEVDSRLISPCHHARRQQRQWHISTGFAGLHAPRAMFLTLACGSAALVVNSGSGMLFLVLLVFSHFALRSR